MEIKIVFKFDEHLPDEAVLHYLRNEMKIPIDMDQLQIISEDTSLAFRVEIVRTENPPVNNN